MQEQVLVVHKELKLPDGYGFEQIPNAGNWGILCDQNMKPIIKTFANRDELLAEIKKFNPTITEYASDGTAIDVAQELIVPFQQMQEGFTPPNTFIYAVGYQNTDSYNL